MKVQELILYHYKSRDFISKHRYFIENPELLNELIEVATGNLNYPLPEYASWWLFHIARTNAIVLNPFHQQLIDCVLKNENGTVLRNSLGVLNEFPLIEYKEGLLLDRLIHLLVAENYKVATQVYSLYLLAYFTKKYPEIKQEVLEIIKMKAEKPLTPALRIGVKNYLKHIKSIN